jgi:hypothetical protein
MGAPENKIKARIITSLKDTERLFRINAGEAWQGEVVRQTSNTITLKNPRRFHGAPPGWPDLAGWRSITITPEMVGQTVAVFWGAEIKAGKDRLRKHQRMFRDILKSMGGIFDIFRDEDPPD